MGYNEDEEVRQEHSWMEAGYDRFDTPHTGLSTGDVILLTCVAVVAFLLWMLAGASPQAAEQDRLSMRLSTNIVQAGNTLMVYCHVPRDEANRAVEAGLVGDGLERRSQQDLEGSNAPITNRFDLKPRDCGMHDAYCAVYRTGDQDERPSGGLVKSAFKVTGLFCD